MVRRSASSISRSDRLGREPGQFRFVGHAASAARKSPGFRQRTARDVVTAAGSPLDFRGQLEQREQSRLDFDFAIEGRLIQPADLAGGAINRQLAFEPIDQIKRGDSQFRAVAIRPGAEQNLEFASHRPPANAKQIALGSGTRRN